MRVFKLASWKRARLPKRRISGFCGLHRLTPTSSLIAAASREVARPRKPRSQFWKPSRVVRRSAFPERGPALALGSRGTFCPTGATVSLGPGASEGHCDVGWGHQAVRSVDHHQRGWRWCLGVGTHTEIPDPRGGSLAGGALCGHTRVPSGDRTVDAAPQTDSNPRSFAVRRLHHHSARF